MENSGFESMDNSASGDHKQTDPQEPRMLSIQRCVKYLVHACQCRSGSCRLPSCQKMKSVVLHAKSCGQKTNGGCPICKQLIALCCYHAKKCQEAKCPVPFCVNIKNKLRQQQLQQRLQQAQILKRRIATMQNRGMSAAVLQPSPGNSNSSSQQRPTPVWQQLLQPNPGNSNSSSQQRPTPAWQQLLQAIKSPPSAQQQQEVLAILKATPQLMAAFIKQRTAQQQQQQQQQQILNEVMTPEITKPAPNFEGIAVINGDFKNIKLSDYKGKYLVLFFYPSFSTFFCPAEIIAFSDKVEEFKKINCEVIGCSTDNHFSHLAWMNIPRERGGLGMMNIPLLADDSCKISKDYGVVCKENEGFTVRGLFIIDADGILRQSTISDLPIDKAVDETLHFVKAFQHIDAGILRCFQHV